MVVICKYCYRANAINCSFCSDCTSPVIHQGGHVKTSQQWGEIKQVTILSADIANSIELIAGLDPELAMHRLRPIVTSMRDEVARFGGLVLSVVGDGIFAVFGAPRAEEEHALLACEAALAVQHALAPYHSTARVRIGLHSGSVVAYPEGGDPTKPTIYGVTAHVADRLQAIATPGRVVMSGDCYSLVKTRICARFLGHRALRGFQQELELYELIGIRSLSSSRRFRRSKLSSFRGRLQEMAFLRNHLNESVRTTSVIGISGRPGTGKSRLCYEFAESCRASRIPVFEMRLHPFGRIAPLQPVLEFIRSALFRITPLHSPAAARRQILRRLKSLGYLPNQDLAALHELLGINDDAAEPFMSPIGRQERLLVIIRSIIAYFGQTRIVIILEDLHWLDEASETFIEALLDAFAASQILLLVNYRTAYTPSYVQSAWFEELALRELPRAEIEALVEELAGVEPALVDLRAQIAHRSGGNPFFAEEIVKSLTELVAVKQTTGSTFPAHMTLPMTVQSAIAAQIDHLNSSDRALLHVVAVLGQDILLPILATIADLPSQRLREELARLCAAELLQEVGTQGSPVWKFRHPLIQEVAYSTQLKSRRELMHAKIARAIRLHHIDRIGEFAALIAFHLEAAGQLLDAAKQMEVAARWMLTKSPGQAIQHWHKVRQLLAGKLDDPGARALHTMASAQVAWLGLQQGMTTSEARPYLAEALRWAADCDVSLIPLLLFVEARIDGASGAADTYVARVRKALDRLKPAQHVRAATLYTALSQAYGWGGLQKHALRANDSALARVAGLERLDHDFLGYSVEHWALSLRGRILARLGRFSDADLCFKTLRATDHALEDPTVGFISHLGGIDEAWFYNDGLSAFLHAESIARLAEAQRSPYLRVFAHQSAGTAMLLLAKPADASVEFEAGLEKLRTMQVANETEAELIAGLAHAALDLGRVEYAISLAEQTLSVARSKNARMPECRACIILALAIADKGDTAAGRRGVSWLRRAERLVLQTGVVLYSRELNQARALYR